MLSGLTNGSTYEAEALAITAFGTGPYSSVGNATPQGQVPGGGATLALRATAGDTEVDLSWLVPDNGGLTITGYTYQWRTSGQSFSTGREGTTTGTTATVTSLTNNTEYFFQARATNSQGDGPWSNETSATPIAGRA